MRAFLRLAQVGEFDTPANLVANEDSLLLRFMRHTGSASFRRLMAIANGAAGFESLLSSPTIHGSNGDDKFPKIAKEYGACEPPTVDMTSFSSGRTIVPGGPGSMDYSMSATETGASRMSSRSSTVVLESDMNTATLYGIEHIQGVGTEASPNSEERTGPQQEGENRRVGGAGTE